MYLLLEIRWRNLILHFPHLKLRYKIFSLLLAKLHFTQPQKIIEVINNSCSTVSKLTKPNLIILWMRLPGRRQGLKGRERPKGRRGHEGRERPKGHGGPEKLKGWERWERWERSEERESRIKCFRDIFSDLSPSHLDLNALMMEWSGLISRCFLAPMYPRHHSTGVPVYLGFYDPLHISRLVTMQHMDVSKRCDTTYE